MKKVTKKLQTFIDSIAIIGKSDIPDDDGEIYYSKVDGSYLTKVGLEKMLHFLLKRGITEQIQDGVGNSNTCCIGFNPIEQKWYGGGGSHRAIFGFSIDSKCEKGMCGYSASNKKDFKEESLRWYGDTDREESYKINATVKNFVKDDIEGVLVEYDFNNKVPNKNMRGVHKEVFTPYPKSWGKEEWTATSLKEAKEMAIAFAKDVS